MNTHYKINHKFHHANANDKECIYFEWFANECLANEGWHCIMQIAKQLGKKSVENPFCSMLCSFWLEMGLRLRLVPTVLATIQEREKHCDSLMVPKFSFIIFQPFCCIQNKNDYKNDTIETETRETTQNPYRSLRLAPLWAHRLVLRGKVKPSEQSCQIHASIAKKNSQVPHRVCIYIYITHQNWCETFYLNQDQWI